MGVDFSMDRSRAGAPLRKLGGGVATALLLAACNTTPGEQVASLSQPTTPVARTITNFEQAKRCMDELFLQSGKRRIVITSGIISDETQSVKVSEQDMIINAIADMSQRSEAFVFFTEELELSSVTALQTKFAPLESVATELPEFYIRGSISQSDNNITQDGASGSVTLPFVSVGAGENQVAGTVSVDLQMAEIASRKILSDATTSNTITIVSEDDSQSARGLINSGSFGAAMSVSLSSARREGRGQAVRTLLEYSLIELLGKFTKVPYQRCLSLDSSDPSVMQTAIKLYEKLDETQRVQAIQAGLRELGRYAGPIDGRMTPQLQDQISLAKDERDLIPNGRVDFALFNAFYEELLIPTDYLKGAAPAPAPSAQLASATPVAAPPSGRDPIGLSVRLNQERFRLGDAVSVRATTRQTARLYCYYEYVADGAVQTVRIFPNRFQPDNLVPPGREVVVPRPQDPVKLRLRTDQEQEISCVATTADYDDLNRPSVLSQEDFAPLSCGYPGIDCPVYQHQGVDPLRTSTINLRFRATP